eukprot:s2222_g3.t1
MLAVVEDASSAAVPAVVLAPQCTVLLLGLLAAGTHGPRCDALLAFYGAERHLDFLQTPAAIRPAVGIGHHLITSLSPGEAPHAQPLSAERKMKVSHAAREALVVNHAQAPYAYREAGHVMYAYCKEPRLSLRHKWERSNSRAGSRYDNSMASESTMQFQCSGASDRAAYTSTSDPPNGRRAVREEANGR